MSLRLINGGGDSDQSSRPALLSGHAVEMAANLSSEEIAEAAATVRRLLSAVEDGTLTAEPGLVARLEGAALALEMLAAARREDS